jgi:hypothetical protein
MKYTLNFEHGTLCQAFNSHYIRFRMTVTCFSDISTVEHYETKWTILKIENGDKSRVILQTKFSHWNTVWKIQPAE